MNLLEISTTKLGCDQIKGDNALFMVGTLILQIFTMTDCESSVLHVTKEFGMTQPEVCNFMIDKLLEKLTKDESKLTFIRSQYSEYRIDRETTKVKDHCTCTCSAPATGNDTMIPFWYFDSANCIYIFNPQLKHQKLFLYSLHRTIAKTLQ